MANKTIENIKNRVSCRSYLDKKVSLKKVLEIAEAGKFAPSAKNRQIANIFIINSKKYVEKLRQLSLNIFDRDCMYGAKTVILVGGPRGDKFTPPRLFVYFREYVPCGEQSQTRFLLD